MTEDSLPLSCIVGLDAYQKEAFKTAVFPPEIGPLYCAMGALGEAGELVEVLLDYYLEQVAPDTITADMKNIYHALETAVEACKEVERLKKLARKGKMDLPTLPLLTDEVKARVKSEQGDCMWYQAGTAEVSGHDLSDVCQQNIKKLRKRRAAKVITSAGETIEERKAAQGD
jgi:hypothetical protein